MPGPRAGDANAHTADGERRLHVKLKAKLVSTEGPEGTVRERIFRRGVTIPAVVMGVAALAAVAAPSAASAASGGPIQNRNSAECMTNGGDTGNSTPITQYTCDGNPSQLWLVSGQSIKNPNYNKCLTNGGATGNSAKITQYTCNGSKNQMWSAVQISANSEYYTIQNPAGTLCLTTGGQTGTSTPITQYKCNGSENQQWFPYPPGG